MLLFDLIDALERKERGDTGLASPSASTMPPVVPPLPFSPAAAGIVPIANTPPIVPWPPGMQPPFGSAPMPWPGVPTPQRSAPTLMDLLYRNVPPMMPRSGTLPWPAIPLSTAALPGANEEPGTAASEEPNPDAMELVPGAETPSTEEEPIEPSVAPQLAQAPKQRQSAPPQRPNQRMPNQKKGAAAPSTQPKGPEAGTIAPQVISIPQEDGSFEIRTGGTRSWRNNNPTNMKFNAKEDALKIGAVGIDEDGHAIFSSEEAGRKAGLANLSNSKYRARTLDNAIKKFAPKHENNTAAYQRFVRTQTGLPGSTKIGSLTPQQMQRLYDVIVRFEGWKEGTTTIDRR